MALSLSPTLLAMLDHPSLQIRYLEYLQRQSAMCQILIKNWKCSSAEKHLLYDYREFYLKQAELFQKYYQGELIEAFREYRDKGMLELLCTAGTHAFLPNFQQFPGLVRQQVRLGIATFTKYFGQHGPLGFWLPECGYYEGLDEILLQEGILYSYIALHGLLGNKELPRNGGFAPIKSPNGLIFFPRDRASSAVIWDPKIGYPVAEVYRDFYQDVGYRADFTVLEPHLPFGMRYYTGIKLWRMEQQLNGYTGVLLPCPYDEKKALNLASQHAENFLNHLCNHSEQACHLMETSPIITTVYDAELFGHWWKEGVHFIEQLFRLNHRQQKAGSSSLEFVTPIDYLEQAGSLETVSPSFSSWGQDSYAQVWLHQENDWIYPRLFELYEDIEIILENVPNTQSAGPYQQKTIKQLIREFSLACASDWAFMIKSNQNKAYAINRTNEHIQNTIDILQSFTKTKTNTEILKQLLHKHRIFVS